MTYILSLITYAPLVGVAGILALRLFARADDPKAVETSKWIALAATLATFVRAAKFLGDLFWKGGDQKIIDGLGPDGVSALSVQVGKGAGRLQSGYVYHYAFVMLLGVAGLLSSALWAWVG